MELPDFMSYANKFSQSEFVIPIVGLSDDLAVLLYVLKTVWTDVDPSIKDRAKEKLSKWFDEDEISEIDNLFD